MGESVLEHYGVKGMHWGVRNAASRAGSVAKDARAASQVIPHKTNTVFNQRVKDAGGLHQVRDKELQAMLNRLNMEKQFRQFMKEDANRRAAGAKALGKILLDVGKFALPIVLAAMAGHTVSSGSIKVPSMILRPALSRH